MGAFKALARPRAGARKAANLLLAVVLALGLVPTGAYSSAGKAFADTGTVWISNTGREAYDGYTTNYFRANGQVAWCSQPNLRTPDGSYSYSTYRGDASTAATAYCIAQLYANSIMTYETQRDYGSNIVNSDNYPIPDSIGPALDYYRDMCNTDDSWYTRFHVMLSYAANEAWPGWCDPFRGCTNRGEWERQASGFWNACWTIASGGRLDGTTQEDCDQLRAIAQTSEVAFTDRGAAQSIVWLYKVGAGTGALDLSKQTSEPSVTDGNQMYTVAGARYGIYSSWDDANGRAWEKYSMTTDGDGYAYKGGIPQGMYYVRETAAPAGYELDDNIYEAWVAAGQTRRVNGSAVYEDVATLNGGPTLAKYDAEGAFVPGGNEPQGDASLCMAEYTIKYYAADDASGDATRTWVLRTDDKGQIDLANGEGDFALPDGSGRATVKVSGDEFYKVRGQIVLPLGTVTVQETKAPEGYQLPESAPVLVGHIKQGASSIFWDGGQTYVDAERGFAEQTDAENVVRCGIAVDKSDLETGTASPLGAASIDGATFEVVNRSEHPVRVGGVLYGDGETVAQLTVRVGVATTDADGDGADRTLPYGTYTVRETVAGEGYNLSADVVSIDKEDFSVDGAIIKKSRGEGQGIDNEVKRGDVELTKASGVDGSRLPGVAFSVTSDTTGESHVVVTDANGYFSTAASKHSEKTNANDAAASSNDQGEIVVDDSKLDASAGIWFGMADGKATAADDSRGALPYDTYTVRELRCAGNAGLQLVGDIKLSVSKDKTTVALGTIDDTAPSIATSAYVGAIGTKSFTVDPEDTVVTDRVSYSGVVPGKEYTISGTVYDKKTGAPIVGSDGKPVTAKKTFTPDSAFGQVELAFSLGDTSAMDEGQALVIAEDIYQGREKVASHKDLSDAEQTVTAKRPSIGTTAIDGDSGTHDAVRDTEMTVLDTVSYKGVIPGREYTVAGSLVDKATGEALKDAQGRPVVASAVFVPESTEGSVEMAFAFDGSNLAAGAQIVAHENLVRAVGDVARTMATHADDADAAQTVLVHVPGVETFAADGASGSKTVVADPEASVVDTVKLTGLVAGRDYKLRAQLMKVGADGSAEPATFGGQPSETVVDLAATAANMTASATLPVDASQLSDGQKLVVFETLLRGDAEISRHADASDEGQTVTVLHPELATCASDGIDGDKLIAADPEMEVVDNVYYNGVVPGREYTVTGTLMVKSTFDDGSTAAEPFMRDGAPVTATATFTPEASQGSVDVVFKFSGADLPEGTELVAFESMTRAGVEVAAHADVDDRSQTTTVIVPGIRTLAADSADGDKNVVADPESRVVDAVTYSNLAVGKAYRLVGELHEVGEDGAAGEAVATGSVDFVPEAAGGTVEVPFDLSTVERSGKSFVAFERLVRGETVVAEHADASDSDQTVEVSAPSIKTHASDAVDGDNGVVADKAAGIVDTVDISNVVPGKEYTLTASAMVLAPVKGEDGQDGWQLVRTIEAAGSATFTPEAAECTQTVNLTVDANSLEGFKVVAAEELSRAGAVVAVHEDAEDADQTVDVLATTVSTTATDAFDGDHAASADTGLSIDDDIAYENAVPGAEHRVLGILMDKSTAAPLVVNCDDANQRAALETQAQEFSRLLASVLSGNVAVPGEPGAAAGDGETGTEPAVDLSPEAIEKTWQFAFATRDLAGADLDSLIALVQQAYPNYAEGIGELAGHIAVVDETFTPDAPSGSYGVTYAIDGSDWYETDGADTVAFEVLLRDNQLAAIHADFGDEGQSVEIVPPSIGTELTDATDGDHHVQRSTTAQLVDTVSFDNLVPGKAYHLMGKLMDKSTGEALSVNGNEVVAETDFTPDEPSGTAQVTFDLDTSVIPDKTVVAFETLTKDGAEVAIHADIDDEAQSVTVDQKEEPIDQTGEDAGAAGGSAYDQTGAQVASIACAAGALGAAGALALGAAALRRRRAAKRDEAAEI